MVLWYRLSLQLIYLVDENSLKSLIPALVELMKSNCGLVTKAGCAYVVTLLVYRHANVSVYVFGFFPSLSLLMWNSTFQTIDELVYS